MMIFIIAKDNWKIDISIELLSMSGVSIYLIIIIIAGLAIAMNLVVLYNKKKRRISRLAGLAFAFVIAGIFLGGQRLIGYTLLGVGIILAIIDILRKANTRMSS